jgi:hypothetical protein
MSTKFFSGLAAAGLALTVGILGAGAASARTFSYNGVSCQASESITVNQAIVTNTSCHQVIAQITYRAASGSNVTVTAPNSSTKSVATAATTTIVSRGANVNLGNGTMSGWHSF